MPESFDQLAVVIRARFAELSPQFQSGAAFLLDHPDEVAVLSMRKGSERAQIQPASLVRFAQQLGFPGWNELRELFVARLRTRPEPLSSRARSLVAGMKKDTLAHDLLSAQRHNLEATAAYNERVIVEAARVLRRAARACPSFFPSLLAATAIAESLVAHLLALEGGQAVEQLEQAEHSLHTKGAYMP